MNLLFLLFSHSFLDHIVSYVVLKNVKSFIILTINGAFTFIQINVEVEEESPGAAHVH